MRIFIFNVLQLSYGNRDANGRKVVVKTGPSDRLNRERENLERLRGQASIRQLIDQIHDPPSLALTHLDQNLMEASNQEKLERHVIKYTAKKMLQGIAGLHENNLVHTGTS